MWKNLLLNCVFDCTCIGGKMMPCSSTNIAMSSCAWHVYRPTRPGDGSSTKTSPHSTRAVQRTSRLDQELHVWHLAMNTCRVMCSESEWSISLCTGYGSQQSHVHSTTELCDGMRFEIVKLNMCNYYYTDHDGKCIVSTEAESTQTFRNGCEFSNTTTAVKNHVKCCIWPDLQLYTSLFSSHRTCSVIVPPLLHLTWPKWGIVESWTTRWSRRLLRWITRGRRKSGQPERSKRDWQKSESAP